MMVIILLQSQFSLHAVMNIKKLMKKKNTQANAMSCQVISVICSDMIYGLLV